MLSLCFFFKQKTAYEVRISDWSSDVCSSDLRVSVSGTSYGGFMSSWLVTQTDRFAAAVPISPVANWYSQHYASQIPWFDEAFLEGSPHRPGGQYFDRSPVFFAKASKTPTLVLAGGRDKNRSEEHTSELQSIMRTSYAVFCLKKKNTLTRYNHTL